VESRGNPNLPESILGPYPPDGVSHLGRMYAPNHVGKPIHQIQDPWDESAVLHKKDNGYLGITCTIYYQKNKNALCDLGAIVNLMLKSMFEELGYLAISPTTMTIQLSSIKYPKGIVENLLVKVC
jgi:hypothetical protein